MTLFNFFLSESRATCYSQARTHKRAPTESGGRHAHPRLGSVFVSLSEPHHAKSPGSMGRRCHAHPNRPALHQGTNGVSIRRVGGTKRQRWITNAVCVVGLACAHTLHFVGTGLQGRRASTHAHTHTRTPPTSGAARRATHQPIPAFVGRRDEVFAHLLRRAHLCSLLRPSWCQGTATWKIPSAGGHTTSTTLTPVVPTRRGLAAGPPRWP